MSTRATLRKYEAVQERHDAAFDRAFSIRREAQRILRQKRAQIRVTVLNEKRDLPF
jgi:hypothetical protein